MKKHFFCKSLLFILAISICQVVQSQQNQNESIRLSIELLESVYDTANVKQREVKIYKEKDQKFRFARIFLDNRNVIKGRIISYNKHGLFVYDQSSELLNTDSRLGFYPFKKIRKVKLGKSYGNFLRTSTLVVAGLTTVIIYPQDSRIAIPWGIILGVTYATFGQIIVAPIYGLVKLENRQNWNLKRSKYSIRDFYAFIQTYPKNIKYIEEFKDYSGNTQIETPVIRGEVNVPQNNTENDVPKTNLSTELSFGTEQNIKVSWIYDAFKSNIVNENELLKTFKNIRGMQLESSLVKNLNRSQLQFLAMMICSGGGFNMKDAIQLTENQRKILGFYEAGFLEEVKLDGSLSTMNLSDIDLENLKVIFDALKNQ